jgi:Fe-S oxidoreductase
MSKPLDAHRREYAYCASCPKLCRFSCPVSEADRSESVTPWGKMLTGHHAVTGQRPVDAPAAEAAFACSGCMRCTENCVHHNDVPQALVAVRSEAAKAGVLPEGVKKLADRFEAHRAPFAVRLPDVAARAGAGIGGTYFPGCTALVKEPGIVKDAIAAAKGVGLKLGVSVLAGQCCGYPLHAAGLLDQFAAHARRVAEAAPQQGPLLVGDPGCAFTLMKLYPQVGVALPDVRLWVDEVARRLTPALAGKALGGAHAYHDACHLGRGLGRYEGPRAILQAALGGAAFREAAESRADGGCSGGGGALPRARPGTANEIAKRQAHEVAPGGETLVTACPASRRMFERNGAKAVALETLLARFFEGETPDRGNHG